MSYASSKQDERARRLQGRTTLSEGRKRREQSSISIRKNARRDAFQKRRHLASNSQPTYQSQARNETERHQELVQLVAMIRMDNAESNYQATFRIRGLLSSEDNPPIQEVISTGIVPDLVEFLKRDNQPKLQFEAAWALTNIASGNSDQTRYVLDQNAVPQFVRLLRSNAANVREQAIWALGNIAGDSVNTRDFVLSHGVMEPLLLNLADQSDYSMLRNATWTLSNLCRRKPAPNWDLMVPALPVLAKIIYSTDDDVLTDACWTLSYLSDGSTKQIQAVVEVGVSRRLVELLRHPSYSVITPALRTIGNIVTGDEQQTQVMVNVSVLPCLVDLLRFPRKTIRKEACWAISNIMAGNEAQIDVVLNGNVIPQLLQLTQRGEFEIKREAAYAISNAISCGSDEQIARIVEMGFIEAFLDLVTKPQAQLVLIALGGLENLLKTGKKIAKAKRIPNPYSQAIYDCNNGHLKIESAQDNEDDAVFDKAHGIVTKYLSDEVEEDQNLLPNVNQNGAFKFGVNNDNNNNSMAFTF
eukprot:TRINITY_DN2666_c0_g1_i1.p1 TRINITY_DN2666_c0_g1~~TRINITY_DN2666_c0_g1_i1.p1  ORF type:complete len:528 (-),score=151.94 TRINITY_DN2666_c0_g1_i1:164-1747(-)